MKTKIRKPNFFLIFLRVFAILLVISIACGWGFLFVMKSRKENARKARMQACIDEIIACTRDICAENDRITRQSMITVLNEILSNAIRTEDMYIDVYIDNERVATTKDLVPVELYYDGEFYMMADNSPMDGLDDFANGMYAMRKESEKEQKYKYDPIAIRLYDFSQKTELPEYTYMIQSAYLNPETKRFYPGHIAILPYNDGAVVMVDNGSGMELFVDVWATYSYYPEDMSGYDIKLDEINFEENGLCLFYPNEYTPSSERTFEEIDTVRYAGKNANGEIVVNEEEYDLRKEYSGIWSVKYSSKPKPVSIFKMFPIFIWAVMGTAILGSLLLSIVIALVLFVKKKAKSEVSDYRKRTTEDMAHDLKTPMAAISGYAEMLEENWNAQNLSGSSGSVDSKQENMNKENAEYVRKIRENVDEMNKMVEGILTFSKSEDQDGIGKLQQVDTRALIEKSVKKHNYLFEKNKIKVKIFGSIPPKTTDPELLSQVMDNLLSNCARYAKPDSEVNIELSKEEITIRNEIEGKIDNVEELIKPFKKGNSARGEEGTGLGLSIVENNLKMLGYSFKLRSEEGEFFSTITIK